VTERPAAVAAVPVRGFARRLLADTGQATFGRVLSLGVWTLLVPVLLRGLGTERFALWSLFFALTGYLSALDLGFSQGTLRHVAAARARGDGGEAGEFALVGLLGYLLLGAAWLALTPFLREPVLDLLRIAPLHRAEAGAAFMLGPIAFAFTGTAMVTATSLQGWGRFDLANGVTFSSVLVQAGGALWSLRQGWGLLGVIRFSLLGAALATLIGLALLRLGAHGFRWGPPARALRRVREAMAFGGPLQLANILGVAHQQLDKLLLSRYVALALVSPYELGLRTSGVLASLPMQMLLALIPAASALHATGDAAGLRAAYDRAGRWVMAITAAVGAGFLAGAPRLLVAWLGTPPPGAELCVIGLTLAMVAAMTTGTATSIARALGRTRYEAEYSGIGLAVHIGLGLWLVPRLGLLGALLSTLSANVLACAWFLVRFARVTGWGFASVFIRPTLQPLAVLALVAALGRQLAMRLPQGAGLLGWMWALIAASLPALVALVLLFATRFLPIAELRALLRRRPAASTPEA
jgi:O-antigen/teichoic acid export membrane protein